MLKSKIYNFFKEHKYALGFALLVGILAVLPQFFAILSLGEDYKGIHFLFADNEDEYIVRIQEMLDGYISVGSPYYFEYKDLLPLHLPTGEFWYALLKVLLPISLVSVMIFTKFLFPAFLFMLTYLVIFRLTEHEGMGGSIPTAIAGGLLVTLGYDFVDFRYVLSLFSGDINFPYFLIWARPVNPITGALLLMLYLLGLLHIIQSGSKKHSKVLLSGIVGALMVGYIFSWSISVVIAGVLAIAYAIKKEFFISRRLLLVIVYNIIITSPYWFQVFRSTGGEEGGQLALRNGMFFTHEPIFNKVVLATIFVFGLVSLFLFFFNKKDDLGRSTTSYTRDWWIFSVSMLVTSIIVFNQQVLTGRTVWPHHFVQYTIPFCFIVLVVAGYHLFGMYFKRFWKVCLGVVIFSSIFYAYVAVSTYTHRMEDFQRIQSHVHLFDWLNEYADKDCVVYVLEKDDEMKELVPAFSHCNVYSASWNFAGLPQERIDFNYLSSLRFQRIGEGDVREYLSRSSAKFNSFFFNNWEDLFSSDTSPQLSEKQEYIIEQYREFLQKDFETELKQYKIDYVASFELLDQELLDELPSLRYLDKFGDTYLYQMD